LVSANSTVQHKDGIVYSLLIATLVFFSRYLTHGALYYVDGPRIVESIHAHTYVIQPPGYWLFAHLGAMFHDPVFGLSFWNQVFSATGAAVFFLLCRKFLLPSRTALLAALAYGSVFFSWFAGDVHSSYASQILFAPLTVYCFLIYREKPSILRLSACALSFSVGAGLRPSDGAFLAPLFIFMLFRFLKQWKDRILLIVLTGILCLAWYVPTQIALHAAHNATVGNQLGSLAWQVSPLLAGINARTIANILRVVLPLLAAFWMLIPTIFLSRKPVENWIAFLWISPGLAFFILIYMADATYLTFLSGGVILLAARTKNQRVATLLLFLCLAFNSLLFLGARPLAGNGRAELAINFYVVKYCNYGVQHQWSSTIGHH